MHDQTSLKGSGLLIRADRIAWAAGFFDGEGCISLTRSKNPNKGRRAVRFQLVITATQCGREPLDIFLSLFGGRIGPHHRAENAPLSNRPSWRWALSSGPASLALEEMLPYFVVKGAQAELALKFQARRLPFGQRHLMAVIDERLALDERDHLEMKALKRLT